MSYEVLRTSTADEHIRGIAQYLSKVSGSSATALRFVSDLQDATQRLAEFPRPGSVPRWGALAKHGYRMLRVGKYLLFYTIDDEKRQVVVVAVVHGSREYWRLL